VDDVRAKRPYEKDELQKRMKVLANPGPLCVVVKPRFDDRDPLLLQVGRAGAGRAHDCLFKSGRVQILGKQSETLLSTRDSGGIVQEENTQ
jgi:hypothetical protein